MKILRDLSGLRFGRLVVRRFLFWNNHRKTMWACDCDCGKTAVVVIGNSLVSGRQVSCGCQRNEKAAERLSKRAKHHLSFTLTNASWKAMVQRCCNEKAKDYGNYGGRGIRICAFLRSSPACLLELIGERPAGRTLDRVNNNGHYSCGKCEECLQNEWPFNIRWATAKEQSRNQRTNRLITINGVTKPLAQWSEDAHLPNTTIPNRLRKGWSGECLLVPLLRRCN